MIHILKYYLRRLYLWSIRKRFPYWWIRMHCTTCGRDVFKRKGDYFMLKPEVWEQVVDTPYTSTRMVICKKCTERLLGRKLTKEDYAVEDEYDGK